MPVSPLELYNHGVMLLTRIVLCMHTGTTKG
jgi:hypothetical protein